MFDFIVSLIWITFFGLGSLLLFKQKNYLYALLCTGLTALGLFVMFASLNSTDDTPEISDSQKASPTPVETTTAPPKPTAPTVTLINDPKNDVVNKQLLKAVQGVVDADFTFDTSIKQIELNENIGTDNTDDFIALISLSYDALHSEATTKKWIDQYTSHLAAKLADEPIELSSLVIFWETPRFKEDWNTAKISFVKQEDGQFYFESENYDASVFE